MMSGVFSRTTLVMVVKSKLQLLWSRQLVAQVCVLAAEKKMGVALEPLKKLNDYEKERGKITKIVASWRERKDDYDNMPNDGDMSIDFSYPNISEYLFL